jgi:hypothetical protein
MLFKERFWAGLADGSITVAFRRWKRPHAKPGGRMRTPAGVLAVDAVEVVTADMITDEDARRAGFGSRSELMEELDRYSSDDIYRVEFHFADADPRERLRHRANLSDDELADIRRRLSRWDAASPRGPWTLTVLRLIAERPSTRAADLAASIGRDKPSFKIDVRKLKELGLTESLEIGYQLSPRGRAVLGRIDG